SSLPQADPPQSRTRRRGARERRSRDPRSPGSLRSAAGRCARARRAGTGGGRAWSSPRRAGPRARSSGRSACRTSRGERCGEGGGWLPAAPFYVPPVLDVEQADAIGGALDLEPGAQEPLIVDVERPFVEKKDVEEELALDDRERRDLEDRPVAPRAARRGNAVLGGRKRADLDAVLPVDADPEMELEIRIVRLPFDLDPEARPRGVARGSVRDVVPGRSRRARTETDRAEPRGPDRCRSQLRHAASRFRDQEVLVVADDAPHRSERLLPAVLKPERPLAEGGDVVHGVRAEQQRPARRDEAFEPVHALFLEIAVAHRERLVDDQDVGLDLRRDREAQAHRHAGRVDLDRLVDKVAELAELEDRRGLLADLLFREAEHRGVEHDVLPAGELRMEPRAELEDRGDLALDLDAPSGRRGDAGEDLEQSALAGAVLADDREALAAREREAHAIERPERPMPRPSAQRLDEAVPGPRVDPVDLLEIGDLNGGLGHPISFYPLGPKRQRPGLAAPESAYFRRRRRRR